MSGIFICPSHGGQAPHITSERIAARLQAGQPVPAEWLSLVVVTRPGKASWTLVDSESAAAAGLDPARSPFVLRDGDRERRLLHDRLLIVKLFPPGRSGLGTCHACLADAAWPQGTERLRVPGWIAPDGAVEGSAEGSMDGPVEGEEDDRLPPADA